MTNNIKCPFCKTELVENNLHYPDALECTNQECNYCERLFEREIWQALIDGKAAQDALKDSFTFLTQQMEKNNIYRKNWTSISTELCAKMRVGITTPEKE